MIALEDIPKRIIQDSIAALEASIRAEIASAFADARPMRDIVLAKLWYEGQNDSRVVKLSMIDVDQVYL